MSQLWRMNRLQEGKACFQEVIDFNYLSFYPAGFTKPGAKFFAAPLHLTAFPFKRRGRANG